MECDRRRRGSSRERQMEQYGSYLDWSAEETGANGDRVWDGQREEERKRKPEADEARSVMEGEQKRKRDTEGASIRGWETNGERTDGKLYDAYIMYPKSLSETTSKPIDVFVLKVLPEVLEKQFSYRLFIFGRDVSPGEAVSDVVDEAISQSRRLVIVLGSTQSKNYLKDDFEQQIAMYDALIRNKIKVILVELEKGMEYSNMPESIQYIKQKQGAIRWKGDFMQSNTKFWKHMRYYMPRAAALRHQNSE